MELVDPNQLEEKFGGKAPNRIDGTYWPPSLPNHNFGVNEKSDVTHIENKYIDVHAEENDEELNEDDF